MAWLLRVYFLDDHVEKIICDKQETALKREDRCLVDGVRIKKGKTEIFYPARSIIKTEIGIMIKYIIADQTEELTKVWTEDEKRERLPEYEGNLAQKKQKILDATEGIEDIQYHVIRPDGKSERIDREKFKKLPTAKTEFVPF